MLKISTKENNEEIVLRIEGKLMEPWSRELELAWQAIWRSLGGRKLLLDIRDTTSADQGGLGILAGIVRDANPRILADTPLTRQFADNVRRMGMNQ